MLWLGRQRGYLSDWLTQQWVRATGQRVDLDRLPWLRGPTGTTHGIGPRFFEEYAMRTGLETHRGISSRLLAMRTPQGDLQIARVRQLLASKRTLYAGSYSVCRTPGYPGQCIKVCFPLPNGRAMVIIRPEVHPDGSLTVISDGHTFGDPGFYFVVEHDGVAWARYLETMKETIHVYPAEGGLVRADHILRIWGLIFLRLHYRLALRRAEPGVIDAITNASQTP